jgi:hypothetical protein
MTHAWWEVNLLAQSTHKEHKNIGMNDGVLVHLYFHRRGPDLSSFSFDHSSKAEEGSLPPPTTGCR